MDCWTAYYNGDHISSTDLLKMICETYLAITILEKRGERFYLATSTLRKDYDVLLHSHLLELLPAAGIELVTPPETATAEKT